MLYILIPGTLIVWGLIIYKIINNMNPETDTTIRKNVVTASSGEVVNDTFSIHPTYRDPFLGRSIQKTVPSSPAPEVKVKPVVPAAVTMPTAWPRIEYNGIIKNQKSNKEMVLMQINGQNYMMKSGETKDGVELFKVFRDSVEVHFAKEKKFIHK